MNNLASKLETLKENLDQNGFLVINGVLSQDEVSLYNGLYEVEITFFTRVLIYFLPGVCIYSLEHLEDFCCIRFSLLKVKVSEI